MLADGQQCQQQAHLRGFEREHEARNNEYEPSYDDVRVLGYWERGNDDNTLFVGDMAVVDATIK